MNPYTPSDGSVQIKSMRKENRIAKVRIIENVNNKRKKVNTKSSKFDSRKKISKSKNKEKMPNRNSGSAGSLRIDLGRPNAKNRKLRVVQASRSRLNCLYLNARSIVNKHSELELYIREENNIDIIGITETWMTKSISDSEMNIEGYTLIRQDRDDSVKQRGGGVAMYIRNDIDFSRREEIYDKDFPESVWCSINYNSESTLIGVCYRAPDSQIINDNALYQLIDKVSKDNVVVIMGDFNFPQFNWNRIETIDESHPFIECINNNFLAQLVEEPTRGNNYLDLILSSDSSLVENVLVGEPFETSDHQLVRFNLIAKKVEIKNKKHYNYFKANYDEIREHARAKGWELNLCNETVDEIWDKLKLGIVEIRNKFVPLSKTKRSKCKWATSKVTKLRLAKKKAWVKYANSNNDIDLYEKYKSKLRKSVRENKIAQCNFEEKLASNVKNDSKSFYAYVRNNQRAKVKVGPLKDIAGNVISDNKTTADIFNKYFSSVFTVENLSSIPNPVNKFNFSNSEGLSSIVIEEEDVIKKLININTSKSQGPDEINPKLLFELRNELVTPLTRLFNLSVVTGIYRRRFQPRWHTHRHRQQRLYRSAVGGRRNRPESFRRSPGFGQRRQLQPRWRPPGHSQHRPHRPPMGPGRQSARHAVGSHRHALGGQLQPDGARILTAGADGIARLWDAATGAPLAALAGHTGVRLSPGGARVVTTSDDHTARLWDLDGHLISTLDGHIGAVHAAVYSPNGRRILTASEDGTARLWDASGRLLEILSGHTKGLFSAGFSPDGARIITASADRTARLWDAEGDLLATLTGHGSSVFSASFSPDGARLLTSSADQTARLWDAKAGLGQPLAVDFYGVLTASFSPDGRQIVTASMEDARLWDTNGQLLAVLAGHGDVVQSAAFSADGARIVTASSTGLLPPACGPPAAA